MNCCPAPTQSANWPTIAPATWEIKAAALAEGLKTLRDDGWTKAIAGHTSVDEVARNTKSDRRGKE